jgi:large subunit ribosomal protein L19
MKKEEKNIPEVRIGYTIKIYYKFREKEKERVQAFEGVVIALNGSGISSTMTIRGSAAGEMMEKIIPIESPNIEKIEIIKKGKVRRAKLYYLRSVIGKKAKLKRKIEKTPKPE